MPTFRSSDGLGLHYTDEGSGPALLCLAGLTRNGRDFDFVAPHLAGVRLIRMDYRGRGRSDWGDPATYQIPVEARDVLELLDHLKLGRTAILGTSRGGLIAMLLAQVAKERLNGAALVDIGPEIATEGIEAIKDYLGRRPPQRTLHEVAERRMHLMDAFEGVPFSRWYEEAERLFVESPRGLELSYDPALRAAVLEGGAQPVPDLWPLFDALAGLPLCTIRGANSNILAAATYAEMRRRRPDMIAAEVPGRGHIPFLDEPESLDALSRWTRMLAS